MEGDLTRGGRESCPRLLNLIPSERDWMGRDGGRGGNALRAAEEKELELRLGPPGGEEWPVIKERKAEASVPSLGYFSKTTKSTTNPSAGAKRGFLDTQTKTEVLQHQQQNPGFLPFQSISGFGNISSQKTNDTKAGHQQQHQSLERKACSSPAAAAIPASGHAVEVHNSSQARTASASVVGWPPIRSFRKNLSGSSMKPSPAQSNGILGKVDNNENCSKGLFVKINMDGIPIGRKVDLKAYDSYEQLSCAVDELFRGLLAAQRENDASKTQTHTEERQAITGLLDGTGEYTLVYEDIEGDRMLAGDVPWEMFVSTVKRLRVLKSSELPALSLASETRKRTPPPDSRVQ